MKINSILGFTLILVLLSACNVELGERGDGNVITETTDVDSFREIILRGGFEILLRESDSHRVTVTTDDNLMDLIEIKVSGDLLEINAREKLRPTDGVVVTIEYADRLEALEVAGAAQVRTDNVLRGRSFELRTSGAGELEMDLDLDYLEIDVSGAGSVDLSGTVNRQVVSMSGAGSYDAENLRSHECEISISGVGGAKVYADQTLDASVSGIGGVEYFGNPQDTKTEVSGLGSIKAADQRN